MRCIGKKKQRFTEKQLSYAPSTGANARPQPWLLVMTLPTTLCFKYRCKSWVYIAQNMSAKTPQMR